MTSSPGVLTDMAEQSSSTGNEGLLPCPICGNPPTVTVAASKDTSVRCYQQTAKGTSVATGHDVTVAARTKDLAIAAWNSRALAQIAPEPANRLPTLDEYRNNLVKQCAEIAEPWSGFAGADKMGTQDREIIKVREEIAAAIMKLSVPSTDRPSHDSKLEAYRKALGPFAAIADLYDDREDDTFRLIADMDLDAIKKLTLGACREAREALAAGG